MKQKLYADLKALSVFTEAQVQKVLDFEKANPEVMNGLRSMKLPVERGGWWIESFEVESDEVYATVAFVGYEGNNHIRVTAYDEEWANERIQSYINEHEKLLSIRQKQRDQRRTEELQLLAELKQKYEPDNKEQ